MNLDFYLKKLGYNLPDFFKKYLNCPSLKRLKNIGYFCGMDYASNDIYDFKEYISRYDHSFTVALLTYKLTKDNKKTLAALFHDIGTPCFSHVIDYMNKDYSKQESTEIFTEQIINNDKYLLECLKEDNINVDDIINFKKYSIVDNERPKLCADRLDGVILTGLFWTKNISSEDIENIINNISIYINEYNEEEIGFKNKEVAEKVLEVSKSIDLYCHSKEDNYMMELLATITRYAITKKYITYDELYKKNEIELFNMFETINDNILNKLLKEFKTKKLNDIPNIKLEDVKVRKLNPLVNNKRIT